MFYGLTYTAIRRLAYGYAVKLKELKIVKILPTKWHGKVDGQAGIATVDWLYGFMRRHPDLTLRKP